MHRSTKGLLVFVLCYLLFTAATCVETSPGPSAVDFTKEKREQLGDLLSATIEQSPEIYTLLDRRSKRDSVIVTYLQALYDQVTQEIRQDRQANSSDRWNPNRTWQVVVLNDDRRYAFSLPGGHFYISTGFLGSLSKGFEIYYLMAFEAVNVSGRYLIDNLISKYNTPTLFDIVDNGEQSNNPSLLDIAAVLQRDLDFQDDIIREIDTQTAELICATSIFDRFGVQTILENIDTQEQWRDTRPSYDDRLQFIRDLDVEGCGTIKSTGLYEKMVLKNLP